MSYRFLRGDRTHSPTADRTDGDRARAGNTSKRIPSGSDGRLSSLDSSLTPDESAAFVRNVAEVAAAAATLAVRNSQSPNQTSTPAVPPPPNSTSGPGQKFPVPRTPDTRHHDWDPGVADLAEAGMAGHDAPNWSRAKSSIILLGATILYAIIAGICLSDFN